MRDARGPAPPARGTTRTLCYTQHQSATRHIHQRAHQQTQMRAAAPRTPIAAAQPLPSRSVARAHTRTPHSRYQSLYTLICSRCGRPTARAPPSPQANAHVYSTPPLVSIDETLTPALRAPCARAALPQHPPTYSLPPPGPLRRVSAHRAWWLTAAPPPLPPSPHTATHRHTECHAAVLIIHREGTHALRSQGGQGGGARTRTRATPRAPRPPLLTRTGRGRARPPGPSPASR